VSRADLVATVREGSARLTQLGPSLFVSATTRDTNPRHFASRVP
jgi:hypothetical protein